MEHDWRMIKLNKIIPQWRFLNNYTNFGRAVLEDSIFLQDTDEEEDDRSFKADSTNNILPSNNKRFKLTNTTNIHFSFDILYKYCNV